MATITIGRNAPTKVKSLSLYKIEEESDRRLVLRAKKVGAFLGGAVLTFMGLGMALAAWIAASGNNPVWLWVVAGLLAALLLLGGIALIRIGFTNQDRIIVDRQAAEVRFEATDVAKRFALRFAELDCVEVRHQDRSMADEIRVTFPLYLVKKGGDEFKVDESSDFELMSGLAEKIAKLSGVRMRIAQPR